MVIMGQIKLFTLCIASLFILSAFSPTIACRDNENSDYDLLIITPKKFVSPLNKLKIHKEKHGIVTKIVELETIYSLKNCPGRDKQEKIKYFIKQEFDNHKISFVLLVGGFRYIPIRYCHNVGKYSAFTESKFISDLYYADLIDDKNNFSSWDSNNNGIYGEWAGSSAEDYDIDLKPDVAIGRLPCNNIFEVITCVNKIIRYEEKTYGKAWFKNMVGVGGDSYTEFAGNEGEINTLNAMNNMPGFNHIKIWVSNGKLTGPSSVIKEINKGCGFIYFDGHGTPNMWATYPSGDNTTMIHGLDNKNMIYLFNHDKLPICIVSGCHNNQFDVHPSRIFSDSFYRYTWVYKCWGWYLVSKIFGGSIVTIGDTGFGYSKEDKQSQRGADSYLVPRFFWEYGINGTSIIGNVWVNAIRNYLDVFPINWSDPFGSDSSIDAKTVQQWALIGDPSLKIGGYPNN